MSMELSRANSCLRQGNPKAFASGRLGGQDRHRTPLRSLAICGQTRMEGAL